MSVPIILYYVYRQNMTGGARVVINFCDLVDRDRYAPVVVSQKESAFTEALRERGVETVVLPLPPVLDVYEAQALGYSLWQKLCLLGPLVEYNKQVRRVAQEYGAKAIWARNIRAVLQVGLAAKLQSIPLIWDVALENTSNRFARLLHALGLLAADRVVTEASNQHEELFGTLGLRLFGHKVQTIHPGIGPQRIASLKNGQREEAAEEAAAEDPFVILTVGTLEPRKNQMMLLRALERLAPRYPRVQAQFVGPAGDEAYRNELGAFVREAGLEEHVEFLGWREDVPGLMQQADLFTMSSRNEGIPYVVHEAMHAGLPIVATEAGGMPDAVAHEQTGYLVPVDDVAQYVDALERCLEGPEARRAMGRAAQTRAQQHFTATSWAQNYQQLLDTLT